MRRDKAASYMISTWSQSAPWPMVLEQSWPRLAKSADRIEGAMIAFGAIVKCGFMMMSSLCCLCSRSGDEVSLLGLRWMTLPMQVYSYLGLAGRDWMGLRVPDGGWVFPHPHGGRGARWFADPAGSVPTIVGLDGAKVGIEELGNDDSGEASEVTASWLLNGIDRRAQLPLTSVESQLNHPPTKLLASAGVPSVSTESFNELSPM